MVEPFTITVSEQRLDAISEGVGRFDWAALPDAGGWTSGVGLSDLRRLVEYWRTKFDWRATERRLNELPQFTTTVAGQMLHFVHARGNGTKPPIMLVHGWPGSFIEFVGLIEPLTTAGHDVVVPSLPGYAFSGRPSSPIGPRKTAELFYGLMTKLYGKRRYWLQGGDWGAAITAWLAHDYPETVIGLHLNMLLLQAADAKPATSAEKAWADRRAMVREEEAGYAHLQGSRPQTLAVAMTDSPVGVAAWILEKFGAWSDVTRDSAGRPDLWQVFDEEMLLTNIMLYVAPSSFTTSTWMYRGRALEQSGSLPAGGRVCVPTAVAAFPDPVFSPPPRSLAEKSYNILRWTQMSKGGHFAALEQPNLLLHDMLTFFEQMARSDE